MSSDAPRLERPPATDGSWLARGDALLLWRGGRGPWRSLLAWVLGIAALFALGSELGLVRFPPLRRGLSPSQIEAWEGEGGQAYLARVPSQGTSVAEGSRSYLRLYEDGVALPYPHVTQQRVETEGGGRYGHWGRRLVFSSSDESDPRTSAHRYAYEAPWTPGPWTWVLLALASAAGAPWLRARLQGLEDASPLAVGALLVAATLVLRWLWRRDTALVAASFAGDLPFSDARLWFSLSEDFARGSFEHPGWGAWGPRRPLNYVIAGSWGALVGFSLAAIVALHALMAGLSSALIWDALRRLVPAPLALVGALVHVCSRYDAAYSLTPLSEPSGYFLSNVALWALALALERESRRAPSEPGPRWTYCGAGVALALSNLSRPLTLLAIAGLPLVVVALRWRGRGEALRGALRAGLRASVFCGAGLALTFAPWIARQRLVYGIWTPSDNTAEMLYATSDPRYGTWSLEVSKEAQDAGAETTAARVAYFNRRTRENLRAHPGYFLRQVIEQGGGALTNQLAAPAPWFALGLLLLGLWGGGGRAPPGWLSLCLILGLGYGVGGSLGLAPRTWAWTLLACALALWRGAPLAILGTTLGLTLLSIGVVSAPYPRFTYSLQWLALPLALWGMWELARSASAGGAPRLWASARASESSGPDRAARALGLALGLLAASLIAGLGLALAARARGGSAPRPRPLQDAPAWRESALASEAAQPYRELWPQLVTQRACFRPGLRTFAPAERPLGGAALPIFNRRESLARTLFVPEPLLEGPAGHFAHCLFPGSLEAGAGQELTLVGVWIHLPGSVAGDEAVFEVMAWTSDPAPAGARWRFGAPRERSRHAALLLAERGLGQVYTPPR